MKLVIVLLLKWKKKIFSQLKIYILKCKKDITPSSKRKVCYKKLLSKTSVILYGCAPSVSHLRGAGSFAVAILAVYVPMYETTQSLNPVDYNYTYFQFHDVNHKSVILSSSPYHRRIFFYRYSCTIQVDRVYTERRQVRQTYSVTFSCHLIGQTCVSYLSKHFIGSIVRKYLYKLYISHVISQVCCERLNKILHL